MDTAVKPIQNGRGRRWSAEQKFSVQALAEMLRDQVSFSILSGRSSSRPTLSLMLMRTPSRRSREEPSRLLWGVDPNDVDRVTQRARLLCGLAMMRSPEKIIPCACGIDGGSAHPSVNGNG
jgi:hypothetical protein